MAKPIIPWIGGKRRLAKRILPQFPAHECYAEPFAGGAALFFMKEPSEVEVLNDINGDLINLYRVVKNHLDELCRQFKWSLISRQDFNWLKQTSTETLTETLTDVQRAARFYYLQKMAFGGRVDGQTFGTATTAPPRLNLLRLKRSCRPPISGFHVPISSICPGQIAFSAMTVATLCSISTRLIGELRATALPSILISMA